MTTPDITGSKNLVNRVNDFSDKMEGVYTAFATRMIELLDRQERIEKRHDELSYELRNHRTSRDSEPAERLNAPMDQQLDWLPGKMGDIDRNLKSHSAEIGKLMTTQRSLAEVVERNQFDPEQIKDLERRLERAMRDANAISERTSEGLSACERHLGLMDGRLGEFAGQQSVLAASLDTVQKNLQQQEAEVKITTKKNRQLMALSLVAISLAVVSLAASVFG